MYKTRKARTTFELEIPKKCMLLRHEAHSQVKMQSPHFRATFGRPDVEEANNVMVQSTKVSKADGFEPFFEVLVN